MSTSETSQPDSAPGTPQNQEQSGPPAPEAATSEAGQVKIEVEVIKLENDFKELQKEFEDEKKKIEESIKDSIKEAATAPTATLPSKIILNKKDDIDGYEIKNFDYALISGVITGIDYKNDEFKTFSQKFKGIEELNNILEIKFTNELETSKIVEFNMSEIEQSSQPDQKKYILDQIKEVFTSGLRGGRKRKNKTKGNRSPIKKKRRTKRK